MRLRANTRLAVATALQLLWLLGCKPQPPTPATTAAAAPEPVPRPNVLLISLDTVRPDHLGCYGYARATSPKLDAFAATATLFTEARCQAPWTLPSHMSLFTSRLPSHCRVEDIGQRLPEGMPTLAEQLAAGGYSTAAFVNDAQMKGLWGFSRGFRHWREFVADTPAGACDSITREAVSWLATAPKAQPFFLFLHYYDAHDPYEAPEAFRKQFDAKLTGEQTRQLLWHNRFPGTDLRNPDLLAQLKAAYDAELAWLDSEVGKVLAAVPPNTLVVLFSDHGEAFEEHGWMTHGASLFEEEIRVVLVVRAPEGKGRRTADPVMLLDVAPTILWQCGLTPPATWAGHDLSPALAGAALPARPQYAETTRVLEGIVLRGVTSPPFKAVGALPGGATTVFALPAESAVASTATPAALLGALRDYVDESDYWTVHAGADTGRLRLAVTAASRLAVVVPLDLNPDTDTMTLAANGEGVVLECVAGKGGKGLYWQTAEPGTKVTLTATRNGEPLTIFVQNAAGGWQPVASQSLSTEGGKLPAAPAGPGPLANGPQPGAFLSHHPGRLPRPATATPAAVDAETMRQLRALGYAH